MDRLKKTLLLRVTSIRSFGKIAFLISLTDTDYIGDMEECILENPKATGYMVPSMKQFGSGVICACTSQAQRDAWMNWLIQKRNEAISESAAAQAAANAQYIASAPSAEEQKKVVQAAEAVARYNEKTGTETIILWVLLGAALILLLTD